MGHQHHHHIDEKTGDGRVFWAVMVNLGLTVAQIIGGILSGSLALIADALHNFSDAISLFIAFFARRIARRPADGKMTFGYGRIEIVAALINYTTLILVGFYLVYEAILRFIQPEGVDGWLVVIIAGVALAVDMATALLTFSLSKESMNIRAAFLHNVADALGSVAVIVAGTLILLYDWKLVDPIVTLMIAGYILWQAFSEIGAVIRMLMLGSPPDLDSGAVIDAIRSVPGVDSVHHLHLWQKLERQTVLDAHIVIKAGEWADADSIKGLVKALLQDRFGISSTTLEMECSTHACATPEIIGNEIAAGRAGGRTDMHAQEH